PARPRSVRPGPGRCLHSMSRYAQPKARPPRRRFRTCVTSVSGLAPQSRTIVTGSLLVLCPARPALRGYPGTPRDHPPRRYSIPRDRTGARSSTRNRPQAEFTLRDLRRSRQPVEHGSPVPELTVPWCSLPVAPVRPSSGPGLRDSQDTLLLAGFGRVVLDDRDPSEVCNGPKVFRSEER